MNNLTSLQETVAERIRAVIAAKRLRCSVVSDSLGISPTALSHKLNGSSAFSVAEIERFAAITGYKPVDFIAESFALIPLIKAA